MSLRLRSEPECEDVEPLYGFDARMPTRRVLNLGCRQRTLDLLFLLLQAAGEFISRSLELRACRIR